MDGGRKDDRRKKAALSSRNGAPPATGNKSALFSHFCLYFSKEKVYYFLERQRFQRRTLHRKTD